MSNTATDKAPWSLNDYLMAFRKTDADGWSVVGLDGSAFPLAKRITCADGFSLSVQATQGAYCAPRRNEGPWHQVEVGFPSAAPEFIAHKAENPDKLTDTVYGYVDIELVEQLIALHGGFDDATIAAAELAKSGGAARATEGSV